MRIQITKTLVVLIGFVLVLDVICAHADIFVTYSFHCITTNDPSGYSAHVGETSLFVDVSKPFEDFEQTLFTFRNELGFESPYDSYFIKGVYFYDGALLGIESLIDSDDPDEGPYGDSGVDFTEGASEPVSPEDLPGARKLVAGFEVVGDADNDLEAADGVQPGEWLGVLFNLRVGQTFDDVITGLNDGTILIGIHVGGFGDGRYKESFINNKAFSGAGSGTEHDPYIITNVNQLQEMNNDLDAWYELGNDIDASETETWNGGKGFVPIGDYDNKFTGHFDGKGHKITNLYINLRDVASYTGLFGCADTASEIKNIGLVDVDIAGNRDVGGLVGLNYGVIANCYATGGVSGGGYGDINHIGGLVGRNLGTISNCYATGSVFNWWVGTTGGFVGKNYSGGTITNSYSTGDVLGFWSSVGGFAGRNEGVCNSCFWDKETSRQSTSAGGEGKTTAEMKQKATFTNWDFDTVWGIMEGVTYPFLSGSNRGFPLSVPYIHQCFDTLESFDDPSQTGFYGWHACGATSAVMALAALDGIVPWPYKCIGSTNNGDFRPTVGTHTSAYGNYVFKQYAYAGEIWGDEPDEVTNDAHQPPDVPMPARGAYGYIHHNPKPDYHAGHGNLIQEFLYKHGIRGDDKGKWPGCPNDINDAPKYISDPDPSIDYVKSELAQGRLLIASTMLGGNKHFVLIVDYDPASNLFIVNDPFGELPDDPVGECHYDNEYSEPYASDCHWGNYPGKFVEYTWVDMCNDDNCLNSTISIAGYKDLDNNSPLEPNNLGQFRSDGNTPISFGELITLPTVVFKGFVEDNSAPIEARDSVRLEIELKRISQSFNGKPTHLGEFTPSWFGGEVNIPVSDLPPGQYHWRARTVDIRGEESPWVSAGNNADSEADFAIGIIMYLCSPADMIVTDPDGLIISKELIQIPRAVYEEIDVNGATHDKVSIPGHKVGEYLIDVIPEPEASPTDTYNLMVEVSGMTVILAEDVQIQDIPVEPYEFELKLNRSDFDSDGDVDLADLATLGLYWLEQDCNYPNWCEGTDLNYNSQVNFVDFTIFAENWLWEKISADFDIDGDVDFADYAILANQWRQPPAFPSADIAPPPAGDGIVNFLDLALMAEHWLEGLDN